MQVRCGKTITIHDSLLERDRQHHPWQSTRWALSFNRRTLVEGLIGANRYQRLSVNRGFFRQTGLVATAIRALPADAAPPAGGSLRVLLRESPVAWAAFEAPL